MVNQQPTNAKNDSPQRTSVEWRTVDFCPAPPGWRVLAIFSAGNRVVTPIAGWLVQDAYEYDFETDTAVRPNAPLGPVTGSERRVVPGICVNGWDWVVNPIDYEGGDETWKVLGPGEPDPSDTEWDEEVRRRAR